jgi:hypothetical protein
MRVVGKVAVTNQVDRSRRRRPAPCGGLSLKTRKEPAERTDRNQGKKGGEGDSSERAAPIARWKVPIKLDVGFRSFFLHDTCHR